MIFLMKKLTFTLLVALLLLMPAFIAYADVIVEPENDFYNRNRNDIVLLERSFMVNSPTGSTSIKTAPGARREIAEVENGEIIYVSSSCLFNGEFWGLTTVFLESGQGWTPHGWVIMDDLLVLYDYVAFAEEHFDEFYAYQGDYEELKKTGAAIVWPWPGAQAPLWTIEQLDSDNFRVLYAYTDDAGREWGFVMYLFGSRNFWVCLSDPMNPDIPAFNPAPPPMEWVSDTPHTDIRDDRSGIPVRIIVMVASVVLGTLVLIKVFWKPNKVEENKTE